LGKKCASSLSGLPAFLHFVENRLMPAFTLFHSLLGAPARKSYAKGLMAEKDGENKPNALN
jgi:hypothetical protein